jgi:lysophospholipase L1-like esterase
VKAAAHGTPSSIDCSVDNEVVTTAELTALATAVAQFNAHIQAEATTRGMAYANVNTALGALVANGSIPAFPDISGALLGNSVLFGPYFTLDGVHPSALAHELIADTVASAINQQFGTTLPIPVCGNVSCPAP